MVRNIAGVLMDVGAGKRPIEWVSQLLELKDRTKGSMTAAPHGLYLVDVIYPDHPVIDKGPVLPHFLSFLQ